jgi:regulatory protein YycI of two-component signal transduction system YycFG
MVSPHNLVSLVWKFANRNKTQTPNNNNSKNDNNNRHNRKNDNERVHELVLTQKTKGSLVLICIHLYSK